MVKHSRFVKRIAVAWLVVAAVLAGYGATAENHDAETEQGQAGGETTMPEALRTAGLALAAAVTVAGAALATARVQAAIGAGGTGVLAEKPELFTTIIILIAIPETLIILGFVMAYLILNMP